MRLIDADKLKKAFDLYTDRKGYLKADPEDLIDNAPQVPNEYMRGYEAAEREYKRPQGEWIPNYTSQFMNPGRQCSLCGKVVEFSENFCPGCGADMRGKEND